MALICITKEICNFRHKGGVFCLVWLLIFFFFPFQRVPITVVVHPYTEGWCETCVQWEHCFEPLLKLAFTWAGGTLVLVVDNGTTSAIQRQALLGRGNDGTLLKKTTLPKPVGLGCCKLRGCGDVAGPSRLWEWTVQFGKLQQKMPSSPAMGSFSGLCSAALVTRKRQANKLNLVESRPMT